MKIEDWRWCGWLRGWLVRGGDDEILFFIDRYALSGKGLGFIDMHLPVSGRLGGCLLWTRDKCLQAAAEALGMEFDR